MEMARAMLHEKGLPNKQKLSIRQCICSTELPLKQAKLYFWLFTETKTLKHKVGAFTTLSTFPSASLCGLSQTAMEAYLLPSYHSLVARDEFDTRRRQPLRDSCEMKPVLANSLLVQRQNFPSPARDSTVALEIVKPIFLTLPSYYTMH